MRRHSYLSPKCEAKTSSIIHRNGVFAKKFIAKGEPIALWGGYVMTLEEVRNLPPEILDYDYPVQIYEGYYLGPKTVEDLDDSEMFNHSCDPNAGVRGQNLLIARRDIQPGEEICFDYETTDTQDLSFECKCRSPHCRGLIDGSSWMNSDFQHLNEGYFSWYIEDKIRKLNQEKHTPVDDVIAVPIQA